ncbi:MAG: hypothetical protein Q4E49_00730 [Bacteroidales bacterium]|nr:hypothetical protein [Bacteroidales bacterium]
MTILKKYSLLSMLILTGLFFFIACSDDEDISKKTSLTGTWKVLDSDGVELLTITPDGGFAWSYQKEEIEYRITGNYFYHLQGDKLTLIYKKTEKYNPATESWEKIEDSDAEYPKNGILKISDTEKFMLVEGNIYFSYTLDHKNLELVYTSNQDSEEENDDQESESNSVIISLERVK